MKKITLLLLLIAVSVAQLLKAQNTSAVVVKGFIENEETKERVVDAIITVKETNKTQLVNSDGSYELNLKAGSYTIVVSCMGYETAEVKLRLGENSTVERNILLKQDVNMLEAANVSAVKTANVTRPQMGVERLEMEKIRTIPALMGEVDLIKTIQLLPGVQSAAEGSSGFNVRGGTPDQNLILLDNAPMYNASHLMGFFSVFNNDAVSSIELYKGDIPAAHGGRLSSLLEVHTKDGRMDKLGISGGIGTISSRLTLEVPIVKDKLSAIVSGRRTYADLFLNFANDKDLRNSTLYFYDFNAKLVYNVNDKNRFYFTGYYGRDKFGNKLADMDFGNQAFVFKWNHLFSDKLFSDITLFNTKYRYKLYSKLVDNVYQWNSNITDYGLRADFTWLITPNITGRFGLASSYHQVSPAEAAAAAESFVMPKVNALENALYASAEQKIGEHLTLKYGLRFSLFQNIGPGTVYNYTPNHEKVDSTVYNSGKIFNTYTGFEPRFGFVYQLNSSSSVKGSYSRTMQYLHLISNSSAGSPLDIWLPASPNVKPQLADQASIGYFRNFLNNGIETSAEVYYKKMSNVVDFKDHAELIMNLAIEGEVRVGEGESYGLELMLRKNVGKLTGWVSYTLSRSMRTIPEINDGKTYRAPADRPHNISVVATYEFSKRLTASVSWIYSTGVPVTYPVGKYLFNGTYIPVYDGRNTSRMPDYHRMDLSVTLAGKKKPGKRWHGEWNFSLYNAYGRKNPWYINIQQDRDNPSETYAEMVYLFSFVPSITYNFTF